MFVLIGSGPGIGLATATLFALKHSSQIVLISRNNERLQQDRQALLKTAAQEKHHGEVQVKTFAVDIADSQALAKVLLDVQKLGRLEVVLFNAARVQPSTLLETPMEVLEQDFKITNLALYQVAYWSIPLLQQPPPVAAGSPFKPCLFVTGGMLYANPTPQVFSLSVVKTAQRNLVQCLRAVYGKEIHVAQVSIGGVVSPDKPRMSPEFVAGRFWELFCEDKGEWRGDVEVLEE